MQNRRKSPKEPLKVVSQKPAPHQIVYKQQTNKGEKFTIYVPLRLSSGFFIFLGNCFKFFSFFLTFLVITIAGFFYFVPNALRDSVIEHLQQVFPLLSPSSQSREEYLQSSTNSSVTSETSSSRPPLSSPHTEPVFLEKDKKSQIPQEMPPSEDVQKSEEPSVIFKDPKEEKTLITSVFLENKASSRSSESRFSEKLPIPEKPLEKTKNSHENIPRLIQDLKSSEENVRANARFLLSQKGSASISALAQAMRNEEYELRREIGLVLGKMGAIAVPTLIEALQNENWSHRYIAADALCDIGPEAIEALPYLIQTTQDSNKNVQESSIKALGEIGSNTKGVTSALLTLLNDNTTHFRILAAESLFKIGAHLEKARQTLQEIQRKHDNNDLRKLAGDVLQKFSQ